ncbi:MAG TPA: oligopeptide/dipeptide ABC transporter ATP-binding protein [Polyangiaceae bacterium]|nr:oligopeptide/dipeptide ABC transporter ATP-binding protein [Polyangiaceae bacterium]
MSDGPVLDLDRPRRGDERTIKARPLMRVENLAKYFPIQRGLFGRPQFLRAVDGVSLHVRRGETLGLVGESGCGKSTLGRTMLRLLEPTYGRIVFDGKELVPMRAKELRALRRRMQIVFQDPYGSLNPRMRVGAIVAEGLRIHRLVTSQEEEEARVAELLGRVGLARDAMGRYPHEFSAGQRQRIGIARALSPGPEFIVCDEPLSALDVSIQAQMINLFKDLQADLGLAYLFISHDLRAVDYVSHRVAVMYLGKIVETAKTGDLFERRHHPYTRALLSAVPSHVPGRRRLRMVLEGEAPSPLDPPSGCPFHPRCPRAEKGKCDKEMPPLEEIVAGSGHEVACFFPET